MHKLEVKNLEKIIKKTKIINDISLNVKSGEVVGLLGPNGAGKTTTFYMICGLISATNGKIFLDEQDISNMPLHKRARQGIGYLPQESSVFKDLSVEENLSLAAEIFYSDQKDIDQKVNEMLNLLNIEPIRSRLGLSLSGGERRRCEIARSLVIKPKFLLLDEPFAGVDPIAVADIQSIINDLKNLNIGVLITDHNVRETLAICDRAYVIKNGSLLASGSANEVANNKLVRTHYLGEEFKLLD
ncbi:putative lipooligosaccharide transport system, ATP-binding component (LptB family) [Campylobacter iguaniorum]|uniref:Putative lipooligosaccharide transport system, ATP-binding component (LptB family) n=1 Tax=Campylobacter iguaniorum TaxID=1244531 RepID=A0A076FFQ6_9BACT|nr:LPS export ABC transporter ATP-binding protein [Campylobacter iguaniorum]AII14674.1 putative lipooligosaccharide transport system, ATP-binding component (LptB family) [Campylobacter iguaniorum]ALV24409.1 putative lipooligosaccharide transport system, ATP-binding component (LptB family) [Campylobacter iguaniorum]ANE35848.1 putative lipooligosaccharide transport system, ATP-binding component (LptB family) [Campylobacter iguaniorum]